MKSNGIIVSRIELARLMGLHPDKVSSRVELGMPVVEHDARGRAVKFDAAACLAWERSRRVGSLDAERARRERSQAELNELKLARGRGELAPVMDFEKAWTGEIIAVRNHLLSWPALLTPKLTRAAAEGEAPVASLLKEEVRQILTELGTGARQKQKARQRRKGGKR